MRILFAILFAIDALAAAVLVYFFLIGIADGSVSSFNIQLWLVLLAGVASIVGGGFFLNAVGRRGIACLVLAILAAPAGAYGAVIIALIVAQPRWN